MPRKGNRKPSPGRAGTGAAAILGHPRSLDANNGGIALVDMGAYEFNAYRFEPMLRMSQSGFQFTVRGEPGKAVRIERSRDLVHWEFGGEVPIPISGQTLINPAATTEPKVHIPAGIPVREPSQNQPLPPPYSTGSA